MDFELSVPSNIYLYNGVDPSEVGIDYYAGFLQEFFPQATINVRDDFFRYWFQRRERKERKASIISRRLAQARVRQPQNRQFNPDPLPGEISFERKFLGAGSSKPAGIIYDGYSLIAILSEMLTPDEMDLKYCHIILTNQLFGTWDKSDHRYHVRVSLHGFPSVISTTGVIEGPARPRAYYLGRSLGVEGSELKNSFNERYIGYGDARLQEIIKGYLLQALFYHSMGDPFCNDKECRLFNAHWQEEMIYAQMRPGAGLCSFHRQMLEGFRMGKEGVDHQITSQTRSDEADSGTIHQIQPAAIPPEIQC